MADGIYNIKHKWRGTDSVLELTGHNYIKKGETRSSKKMKEAVEELRPFFYPIFGDLTCKIFNDSYHS